jgi:hypothetical protein
MNVFVGISFGSTIKLIIFDKSQVISFMANSFAVSGMVIAGPGVGATIRSLAYKGSLSASSIGSYNLISLMKNLKFEISSMGVWRTRGYSGLSSFREKRLFCYYVFFCLKFF